MNQLLLMLLLTSLITPSAFSQKKQLDREVKNLKGNVKSVESASSPIDKASAVRELRRVRTGREEFDASGNLTAETNYDQYGEVLAVLTYSYLDGERVVKEELKGKKGPRYTVKLKYKYDSNGNRTESTQVLSDGSTPTRLVYNSTAMGGKSCSTPRAARWPTSTCTSWMRREMKLKPSRPDTSALAIR